MFQRKLTLDPPVCAFLEGIRLALEVLEEAPIRFKHLEFKGFSSGRGVFLNNDKEIPFSFIKKGGAILSFELGIGDRWYCVHLDSLQQVWLGQTGNGPLRWIVGSSANDRREEPLFPELQRAS
jgi:hypothetical protein